MRKERVILTGDVPSPIKPPSGCHFHTRCPVAEPICKTEEPVTREIKDGHWVTCHRYAESNDIIPMNQLWHSVEVTQRAFQTIRDCG